MHKGIFTRSVVLTGLFSACVDAFAASQRVLQLIANIEGTVNAIYNTAIVIFTLVGTFLVARSLYGFYRVSAGEQQSLPVRAYWVGLLIGGLLTALGLVAAIATNTWTQ